MSTRRRTEGRGESPYLEPLVLKHSLDGGVFPAGRHLGLKDHTEGAIADNLTLSVGDLLGLAGQSILDFLTDDLCGGRELIALSSAATSRALTTHAQTRKQPGPTL